MGFDSHYNFCTTAGISFGHDHLWCMCVCVCSFFVVVIVELGDARTSSVCLHECYCCCFCCRCWIWYGMVWFMVSVVAFIMDKSCEWVKKYVCMCVDMLWCRYALVKRSVVHICICVWGRFFFSFFFYYSIQNHNAQLQQHCSIWMTDEQKNRQKK